MTVDIKTFVRTSHHFYDPFIKKNKLTLDFYAVTTPILKGFELILFDIFAIRILTFLKSRNVLDLGLIDECFFCINTRTNDRYLREKVDEVEYGLAIRLAASVANNEKEKWYMPNKYFIEFIKEYHVSDPEATIKQFCERFNVIREIRNRTAHKNRIFASDAKECLDFLLINIKFIEYMHKICEDSCVICFVLFLSG